MEIVNNRYRIIKRLKQNRLFSTYLVSDLLNQNTEFQLYMLNSEFIPSSLITYYTDEFIGLINLSSDLIIKNYRFNTISHIDNKKTEEKQYFFISEYFKESMDLFDYIRGMDVFQIFDVFIKLCRAIHYLHLKGYVYGSLNLNTILIKETSDGSIIKLRDLATVELEKYLFYNEQDDYSVFKYPKLNSEEPAPRQADFYSLCVLLLSMLKGHVITSSPKNEMKNMITLIEHDDSTFTMKETQFLTGILPLLENLIQPEPLYSKLNEFIDELNGKLQQHYQIVYKEELDKLNIHTKIIGRENEVETVLKAYDQMIAYQSNKKIFIVKGDTGTGKTRFLKEIKFLLELKKANVYASFQLQDSKDSSNKVWVDILKKMLLEADKETIEKYETELTRFFPGISGRKNNLSYEDTDMNQAKYRILNRIAGFISESIKSRPAVILVDNLHFADDLTIDTFQFFCSEIVKNHNLIFIFSIHERESYANERMSLLLDEINKRNDSETVQMRPFDLVQTAKLIQSILFLPAPPMRIAERIFQQSYGNPLFIGEIIKDLYSRKIIYIHNQTGAWWVDLPDDHYQHLSVPNSVEQALVNQINDSDPLQHSILKVISIFNNEVPLSTVEKFLSYPLPELEVAIQDLVNKGILVRSFYDHGYMYSFHNHLLKDIVYERISPYEKVTFHNQAANILEVEQAPTSTYKEELIFHLEKAGQDERVMKYCLENANQLKKVHDANGEIYYLKKILSKLADPEEKASYLLHIGSIYFELGEIRMAEHYYMEAEGLALETRNEKLKIDVYVKMADLYSFNFQEDETRIYLQKLEILLEKNHEMEAYLEYQRIKSTLLADENKLEEAKIVCMKAIDECGEKYPKEKGSLLRLLGYIYSYFDQFENALAAYHQSVTLLESVGHTRGVLITLNNIGALYNDTYQDHDKALTYFIKVRDLSADYGLMSSEVYGLINVGSIYMEKFEYESAYQHLTLALEKAIKNNYRNLVFYVYSFLTRICLFMSNFQKAIEYYRLLCEELDEHPNQGMDIVEFYCSSALFYRAFGEWNRSIEYEDKVIDFLQGEKNLVKINAQIRLHTLYVQLNNVNDYDTFVHTILQLCASYSSKESQFSHLVSIALMLATNNHTEQAHIILTEAEKLLEEEYHDEWLAKYFYTTGLLQSDTSKIHHLQKAFILAQKANQHELEIEITMHLGDFYFENEQYLEAANYYIEAREMLKPLIHEIPEQYRVSYVNKLKAGRTFFRLKYILYHEGIYHDCTKSVIKLRNQILLESTNDFISFMEADETSIFIQHKEFMNFITAKQLALLPNDYQNETEIYTNLSSDSIKNINIILQYLAAYTLSTRGWILLNGNKENISVMDSIHNDGQLPSNPLLINKVRMTMQPVFISERYMEEENNAHLLGVHSKASLCIPIMNDYFLIQREIASMVKDSTIKSNILGFLYLESDRAINNFTKNGLEKCTSFINLLALLIEKHQLKISASLDKLTGVLTRKFLEDSLTDTLTQAILKDECFSLIMFDIDKFKNVNDRFGHQTGDEVLRKVSTIIQNQIRKTDIIGRYGGEEFLIILPSTNEKQAYCVAEKLRKQVEAENILGNKASVTISLGVATYPVHAQTINELIDKADQALYKAKESGRNRSEIWDSLLNTIVKTTNKLSGIYSGNEVRDSRNILALIELIQLTNKSVDKSDKIYEFLGRTMEAIEAEYGIMFMMDNGEIIESFGRKTQQENWLDVSSIHYNDHIVNLSVETKQGQFMIDWEHIQEHNLITGLPEWYSVISVPIMKQGQVIAVVYLSSPIRVKEFGVNELNIITIMSDLAANII